MTISTTIKFRSLQVFVLLGIQLLFACTVDDSERKEPYEGEPINYVDSCRHVDEYIFFTIEDFELGIGKLWWVSSDGTGTVFPLPGREPEATLIPDGLCGTSKYALNLRAENMEIFGGAFGINFFPGTIDASEWEGISFWAKRKAESSSTLFISISEQHTDEENGKELLADGEPFCLEQPQELKDKCDRFGAGIGLEEDWKFYTIPFDELQQRGFGVAAPFQNLTSLIGLNIAFETGNWDIWIDEVSLYKTK